MSNTLHAFDFLADSADLESAGVIVVFGGEWFLQQQVTARLKKKLLGDEDQDVPIGSFNGESCQWRDVIDEISTLSLFGGGGPRLAVVDNADTFVSENRSRLEDYLAKPKSTGKLILLVSTWASNTRLYKRVDKTGLQIECKAPTASGRSKSIDEKRVGQWLTQWAKSEHQFGLPSNSARHLLELVGVDFGLLEQNLAKLALFVTAKEKATPELIDQVVGGWKSKTIWETVEYAVDGHAAEALTQLDHLLQSGEHPRALFGQLAWSLRRYAIATDAFIRSQRQGRRSGLSAALKEAGFRDWPKGSMQNAERQLKQLGRPRAIKLHRWLLDTDLALKGTHSSPSRARYALEQLFCKMAKEVAPPKKATS